jgi:hypothetical protein
VGHNKNGMVQKVHLGVLDNNNSVDEEEVCFITDEEYKIPYLL